MTHAIYGIGRGYLPLANKEPEEKKTYQRGKEKNSITFTP
jgi:hypothetical protein